MELLGNTESRLADLTEDNKTLNKLKNKLEAERLMSESTLQKQRESIEKLTSELEQLRFLHETTSKDSQLELKVKLEMLNKELNGKWQDKLRLECERLRNELNTTMEAEKRDEIDMLNKLKDQELKNLKTIWQTKTNELLDEVIFKSILLCGFNIIFKAVTLFCNNI